MSLLRAVTAWPAFDSLHNSDFRWFWWGRLASSATFQMGAVAQGWLVYQLTGSAFALGWVGAGGSIATLLLSLYGGVLSDRFERRTILLWTRLAMVLNSLVIGLLITIGAIQVWHIAASAMFSGVLMALMMPAQNAIMSDIVGSELLLNAVSLSAVGMGLMGVVAASLAGVMIESVGVDAVYYGMGAMYVVALFTLWKLPRTGVSETGGRSVWHDLQQGVQYMSRSGILLSLIGLALVRVLLGMPYTTLMPAYARDVLHFDARGLGLLSAAPGLGSLIAAMSLASLGNYRRTGRLLLISGVALGVGLVAFANSRNMALILTALAIVGAASNSCMVGNQTLIQGNCIDRYRGRVLSIYMMTWGLTPLGTLPAGALADHYGVPLVVSAQGILCILSFVGLWFLQPRLRRLE